MNTQLWEKLSAILPTFEIRVILVLTLLLLNIIVDIVALFLKHRSQSKIFKVITYDILNIIVLVTLIWHFKEISDPIGIALVIMCVQIVVSKILLIMLWKKISMIAYKVRFIGFLWRKSLLIYNILTIGAIIFITLPTLNMRPYIIHSTPEEGEYMDNATSEISVEFDIPVKYEDIRMNISPDIPGEWRFEKVFGFIPLSRKATFTPKQSFYPGDKIVIYVVGMENLIPNGIKHDQAREFFAPKVPNIRATTPANDGKNVQIDKQVVISFDSFSGDFIEWKYEISPTIPFSVNRASPLNNIITFDEPLLQDQDYNITIYRTPRSYVIDNPNTAIKVGDTENTYSFKFRTVSTPLVKEYSPQGDTVHTDAAIRYVFEEDMNKVSVEKSFSITPAVKGKVSWENERTFVFTPDELFPKETEYSIVFAKGIYSAYGGITKEDITTKFTTIGKVRVNSFTPGNETYGLDPRNTNLVVEFNQEVDHESAQQHLAMSPAVSGTFSWDGNKMIYNIAGNIGYSTRYTFTVTAGVKTVYGLDSAEDFSTSFVTRDNIFSLGVPQLYQNPTTESFDCNIVATRMVLAYRGIYRSNADIKNAIGYGSNPNVNWVDGYGVHWDPIANYIRNQGLGATVKTGWNTAELAQEVENGHPVILWWWNRYATKQTFSCGGATCYRGMHSEVVRGFIGNTNNPSNLLINDPWRGQLNYSRGLFDSTWGYIGYTAVVVY